MEKGVDSAGSERLTEGVHRHAGLALPQFGPERVCNGRQIELLVVMEITQPDGNVLAIVRLI